MKNVFLFIGTEELIIRNKIEKVIKAHHCDEYNTTLYDMEETNVSIAIQDALTPPFMCEEKIVIIKNPTFLSNSRTEINHHIDGLIDYVKNPFVSTIFIIDATNIKIDSKSKLMKILLENAEVSDTKDLTPVEEEGWLKRQFTLEGIEIKEETIKLFFNRLGHNLLNAKNEVDKLINYIDGRKIITNQDVIEVVTKESELETFALTNAIICKDKEKIIQTFQELKKNGKDAIQLLGMISRAMIDIWSTIIMIKHKYTQAEIANTLRVSTGRAYYLIRDSKTFSANTIQDIIIKLAGLDYKIKSFQIEPHSGLELFLFGL